jgi:hypothetical protein
MVYGDRFIFDMISLFQPFIKINKIKEEGKYEKVDFSDTDSYGFLYFVFIFGICDGAYSDTAFI